MPINALWFWSHLKMSKNVFWVVAWLTERLKSTLFLAFEANRALSSENETKIVKITHSVEEARGILVVIYEFDRKNLLFWWATKRCLSILDRLNSSIWHFSVGRTVLWKIWKKCYWIYLKKVEPFSVRIVPSTYLHYRSFLH